MSWKIGRSSRPFRDHYSCGVDVSRFYETPVGVSETVPDQSMSVSDMLKRHARGLTLSDAKVPLYESESEMVGMYPDNFEHWDLADQEAYLEDVRQRVGALRQKEQEILSRKRKEERDAAIQAAVAATHDPQGRNAPQYPKKTPPEGPPAGSPKATSTE